MPEFFYVPVHGVTHRPGPGARVRGELAWSWNDVQQRGSFAGNVAAPAPAPGGLRGLGQSTPDSSISAALDTTGGDTPLDTLQEPPYERIYSEDVYIQPELVQLELRTASPLTTATPTTAAGTQATGDDIQRLRTILSAQRPAPAPSPTPAPVPPPAPAAPAAKRGNGLVWLGILGAAAWALSR